MGAFWVVGWMGCPTSAFPSLAAAQSLAEGESALAGKESKLALQHADLADRAAALESARARLDAEQRELEQREENLQRAQSEVRPCVCVCLVACLALQHWEPAQWMQDVPAY